jgi:hypothetical protein
MLWAIQDLLSHPLGALVCAGLAWRRGGSIWGPLLLGLVLGWGALPVMWLLTREERSGDAKNWEDPGGEPGLNPTEPRSQGPWTGWPEHYFALRQSLILRAVLALVPLPGLGFIIFSSILPTLVSLYEGMSLELPLPTRILICLGKFLRSPLGLALLWALLAFWPICLALLLQSSYRVPILGRVWRHSDRIWRLSGLANPSEVGFRCPANPEQWNLDSERAALSKASANTRILGGLAALSWFLCLGLIVASWFVPMYQISGNIGP